MSDNSELPIYDDPNDLGLFNERDWMQVFRAHVDIQQLEKDFIAMQKGETVSLADILAEL